ncbi:hypothetical protein BGZ50_009548 [Haplosporangium sp. Z 11]|nr:hypothetical protein BGZ50_009548 [Haplosporangium sp. Z 11]
MLIPNQRLEERTQARLELHKLFYTPNEDHAFVSLNAFQGTRKYRAEMLQFLYKDYFTGRELWGWIVCFGDNSTCTVIGTNSYVESWRNAL